jgi:hypothetical protein
LTICCALSPKHVQVLTVDLDGDVGADARFHQFLHPHFDGLHEAVRRAGSLLFEGFFHGCYQFPLRSPIAHRLEHDVNVALVDRHRVHCDFRPAGAANDLVYFRKLLQYRLDDFVAVERLTDRDTRHPVHHHEDGSLIQTREELGAQKGNDPQRAYEQ